MSEEQMRKLLALIAPKVPDVGMPGADGAAIPSPFVPKAQPAPVDNAFDKAATEGSSDFDEFMGDLDKEASHTAKELREQFGKWVERKRPRRADPLSRSSPESVA